MLNSQLPSRIYICFGLDVYMIGKPEAWNICRFEERIEASQIISFLSQSIPKSMQIGREQGHWGRCAE
jgi:hypothetical protein